MENKKVKKVNMLYLVGYILIPTVVIVLCAWCGATFFGSKGKIASALFTGPFILSVLWWVFGGRMIYDRKRKAMEKELDAKGFVRNHTFKGSDCTVIVDAENGQIALLFRWNPFAYFVLPTSRISKAWVDDGRFGAGFMEGSNRVSFLFLADGVKVRVNMFFSNKRWRMDSDYILTGISKADMMVKILEAARTQNV